MAPICGLSVTVFCSAERFCPSAGIHRWRRPCPGHLVSACYADAEWTATSWDGRIEHACGDHHLEMAAQHPGWDVRPFGPLGEPVPA